MILKPGITSVIKHVFIQDSTSTTGAGKTGLVFGDITAYYVRAGGVLTALTLETIATLGTWASSGDDYLGFKLLHDTNAPGVYELHLPNNILAAGANQVTLQLRASGAAPCQVEIQLADVPADVTKIAGSAVDTAAAQLGVNVVNWKGSAAPAMTGDAFARLGAPAGADMAADVAAVKGDTAAILTDTAEIGAAGAGLTALGDARLANLDALISSRLAAAGYTAPDNAGIATIQAKTDNLPADPADQSLIIAATDAIMAAIAALNNLSQAQAQTAAASALTAYDPPTKAELDAAATLILDRLGTPVSESIAGDITQVKTDTGDLKTLIGTPIDDLAADITAVLNAVGNLNDLSVAEILAGGVAAQSAMESLVAAAVATIRGVDNDTLKTLSDQIDGIEAGSAPTAEEIADAVWNEILAGHLGAGSTGAALNAAGSAGDPWITEIPGDYPAGSAGYLLGNRIDAAISEILGGDLSDAASVAANSPADLLRKIFWFICNKLVIIDANGNFTVYKTDGITPAATGSIVDNGVSTVRSAPTWP